jgi:hypothetical protein
MKSHLQHSGLATRIGAQSDAKVVNDQGTPIRDYHLGFQELFCTAAAELADDLHQPLENLGIMYDVIVHTGQTPKALPGHSQPRSSDLERDGTVFGTTGKGQLLFLVREADRQQAQQLQASGYRFALPANVIPIIASTFQISSQELTRQMESMHEYVQVDQMLEPGVHLAFFAVKASMGTGFDVLVRRDARNKLPTMQLPFDTLDSWQLDYLRSMANYDVSACLKYLGKSSKNLAATEKERLFASQLLTSLDALKDEIHDPIFNDACLIAEPVHPPCRGLTENSRPGLATLITFSLMAPVGTRPPGKKLDFIPLSFFKTQQHVFKNSPDHEIFARKTYREFAPVLDLSARSNVINSKSSKKPRNSRMLSKLSMVEPEHMYLGKPVPHLIPRPDTRRPSFGQTLFSRKRSKSGTKMSSDNSSEKDLVEHLSADDQPLGGIMVSQEVEIHSKLDDRPSSSSQSAPGEKIVAIEMSRMSSTPKTGVFSTATAEVETESYVDELFKICIRSM